MTDPIDSANRLCHCPAAFQRSIKASSAIVLLRPKEEVKIDCTRPPRFGFAVTGAGLLMFWLSIAFLAHLSFSLTGLRS